MIEGFINLAEMERKQFEFSKKVGGQNDQIRGSF
jgi:hypothetical protein